MPCHSGAPVAHTGPDGHGLQYPLGLHPGLLGHQVAASPRKISVRPGAHHAEPDGGVAIVLKSKAGLFAAHVGCENSICDLPQTSAIGFCA